MKQELIIGELERITDLQPIETQVVSKYIVDQKVDLIIQQNNVINDRLALMSEAQQYEVVGGGVFSSMMYIILLVWLTLGLLNYGWNPVKSFPKGFSDVSQILKSNEGVFSFEKNVGGTNE